MIIEGQVHGGLTEALAIAMGQEMDYDADGNLRNASLLDFFLPTPVETPAWETDYTTTPFAAPSDRRQRGRRVTQRRGGVRVFQCRQ